LWYRLYAVDITMRSRSLLARIYHYIDIVAPALPRAFLYAETGLILYSTTTKLIPLFKLIVDDIGVTKPLGMLISLLVALSLRLVPPILFMDYTKIRKRK
jgi:hypothetical protein